MGQNLYDGKIIQYQGDRFFWIFSKPPRCDEFLRREGKKKLPNLSQHWATRFLSFFLSHHFPALLPIVLTLLQALLRHSHSTRPCCRPFSFAFSHTGLVEITLVHPNPLLV